MPTPEDLTRSLSSLNDLLRTELNTLLQQANGTRQAWEILNDVLPDLIREYGAAAATIGAEWYDDIRLQYLPDARNFSAIPVDFGDQGTESLLKWANGTANSFSAAEALIIGGASRRVSDWARETIMGSSLSDPRAEGWMRVGKVSTCAFCRMLISRGAVYTRRTVTFASHDSCNCGVAPKFAGADDVFDVGAYRKSARNFDAEGNRTDAAKRTDAAAKAYIRANNL